MSSFIALNLSDPSDSKAEKQIVETLQDLVNDSLDPVSAAKVIDQTITTDCQEAYDSYTSVPNVSTKQLEDGTIRAPQPAGWQKFLWDCLGKAAMKLPAEHTSQDSLVKLLQGLQQLPHHHVPWLAAGQLTEKELWNLTPANKYDGLEQWLWELDQGTFTGTHQIERDAEKAAAYVNFSAFLARLLGGGVAEVTRLSALIRPSPFAVRNPPSTATHTDVSGYEPYASAAAQWVLYAGDALYEMCEKSVLIEVGRQRWTRALWDSWKGRFEAISKDTRFSNQARHWVTKALDHMAHLEKQVAGPRESVVQIFGFITPEDDDSEEE